MFYYNYPIKLICSKIERILFEAEMELIQQMEDELIYANNEKLDAYYEGFRHLSKFITLRDCASSKYKLPRLSPDLFEKFNEYQKFVDEWAKKELFIDQFLKKVLIKGLKVNTQVVDDNGKVLQTKKELSAILPKYLLEPTGFLFDPDVQFEEDPELHDEWEQAKKIINEMLALRMIVSK